MLLDCTDSTHLLPKPHARTAKAGLEGRALQREPSLPGSLSIQQREINSLKVRSSEQKPSSGAFQEWFINSRDTTLGFCFELPGRGACLSLLITKVLFSTQQSLMDCCVLQLLSLHSCLLLSLKIDVNLVQREEEEGKGEGYTFYTFYLLGFIRGVENRCLTSVLRHF